MRFLKIAVIALFLCPFYSYAQKTGPVNSGELIREASKLYDSAQYKKADALLTPISRSDTNYVWALYSRALACEADSQYNKAIEFCQEGLKRTEQREYEADLYNTYGNTLNDMKRRDEALNVFDAAIARYPSYSLLYFNKGVVMLALEKPKEAEALFQKALLINPYMYSAHYELAVAAYRQGKILPCFLSLIGYLTVNPAGKYRANCIKVLSDISRATDEITDLKNKSTWQEDENYRTAEEILLSKAALDPGYKPMITIDDPISRQIQAVFEKLDYVDNSNDFWIQYYMPLYKSVFNKEKFEPFINWIFSDVKIKVIEDFNKSNAKQIGVLKGAIVAYYNAIRETRLLNYGQRDTVKQRYYFENGVLAGKGAMSADGKLLNGHWNIYYSYGTLEATGDYNSLGKRDGEWKFYFNTRALKAIEHYKNGKLEGGQRYFFSNGNPSSIENAVAGLTDGRITTFYYAGTKHVETSYKNGKQDGLERRFYTNGDLMSEKVYANGVLNGPSKEFYKNGRPKVIQTYVNGKSDGQYKSYDESGFLSYEGTYSKDNAEGEWKYYYPDKKLKEKRSYINDKEEGLHQEFFENGQISASYTMKKDKITGEADFYDKDGKLYSILIYNNGTIMSAKYLDKAGHELSSAKLEDKSISIVSFTADGYKQAHFNSDQNGDLQGPDTLFYRSGKIQEVNEYKKGQTNGMSVSYFKNGNKKTEINMDNGKENGYLTTYYENGKVQSEGWVREGDYAGEWHFYDEQGHLTSNSYYQDGDLSGYREEFTPDSVKTIEEKYHGGWLQELTQYDHGKVILVDSFPRASGVYKLIYPNGKPKTEARYINGDFDGKYSTYFFDGSPESITFYKRGLRDSLYVEYYFGGLKSEEGRFTYGVKTGTWKSYDENGKLSSSTPYENDLANGESISFFPDGTKNEVSTYKDDALDGPVIKYEPGGGLAYQVNFEDNEAKSFSYPGADGKLVADTKINTNNGALRSFYSNGKPSRICFYTDGVKNGVDILYYSNGQMRSIDTVSYGSIQGIKKEFYPNGNPKLEYRYKDDNTNGIQREYNSDGKLIKEMSVENGVNNGPAKYYDGKGKLTRTMTYVYGTLLAVKNEE